MSSTSQILLTFLLPSWAPQAWHSAGLTHRPSRSTCSCPSKQVPFWMRINHLFCAPGKVQLYNTWSPHMCPQGPKYHHSKTSNWVHSHPHPKVSFQGPLFQRRNPADTNTEFLFSDYFKTAINKKLTTTTTLATLRGVRG